MSPATEQRGPISIPVGVWSVDPERSEIGFAVASMWGLTTVRGAFTSCEGSLDTRTPLVTGELAIHAGSLETGNARRDRHLRSPDFLDADRHPWIVFRPVAFLARDEAVTIGGALSIADAETEVELGSQLDATAEGDLRVRSTATISRAAVGVSWNWLGVIGDDVTVSAQITLTRTDDGDAG